MRIYSPITFVYIHTGSNFWRIANIFTNTQLNVGRNRNYRNELCFRGKNDAVPARNGGRMSYTSKPLEELSIMDDFLMNAVAADAEVGIPFCQKVLSVLLQREIGTVRIVAQRTIPALTPNLRGIRMDVEVAESMDGTEGSPVWNLYDLEPHLQKDIHLPRHNRFYQAKIDSRYMKRGDDDFAGMPNLYVITITNFDPFGYGYMMYHISNQCREVPELSYGDGLQFIYFYTEGKKGGNADIQAMLKYFKDSTEENATTDIIKEVHRYVSRVKVLPEVRQEYMKFDEIMYYAKKDGQIEARVQDIMDLLEDYGEMPGEVRKRLEEETNLNVLKSWHKIAAKAQSMQEFVDKMDSK